MDLYKIQQQYYLEMLNKNIFEYNLRHKNYFKIMYCFIYDKYYINNKIYFNYNRKRKYEEIN
jgi:hypothetical protein